MSTLESDYIMRVNFFPHREYTPMCTHEDMFRFTHKYTPIYTHTDKHQYMPI